MKKNSEKKEALRCFLNELFETKFSREKLLEKLDKEEIDKMVDTLKELNECSDNRSVWDEFKCYQEEEKLELEEKCVEPFKLLEPEEMELDNENQIVPITEEELKEFNDMANEIQRVDELKTITCYMDNGKEKMLVDGSNCNIKQIPILDLAMVTPSNLSILEVLMNDEMESYDEIMLTVMLSVMDGDGEHLVVFKTTADDLGGLGMLIFVDVDSVNINLSPTDFRSLTKAVSLDEIEKLFN